MPAMSKSYPYIKYPKCIQDIYAQEPEIPQLNLPSRPLPPIIEIPPPKYPPEPQEPTFDLEKPSQKYAKKKLLFVSFVLTIFSLILGKFFNLPWQQALGVFLIFNASNFLLYWILQTAYQKELKQYFKANKDFQKNKDTFLKEDQEWDKYCQEITRKWSQKKAEAKETANQQDQTNLAQWREECRLLRQKHQKIVEQLQDADYLKRWRQEKIHNAVVQLKPLPLQKRRENNYRDKKGYTEFGKYCEFPKLLQKYFGKKIQDGKPIDIPYLKNPYTPDFAYLGKIYIDIEIDEPYNPRQYPNIQKDNQKELEVIHCIDNSKDENRNQLFNKHDWFVIRFSEKQVILQSHSCCQEIARLIAEMTGDTSVLEPFRNVPDLEPDPRWTEEQAKAMAEQRVRLKYNKPSIKKI